jgi:hypothetical protein
LHGFILRSSISLRAVLYKKGIFAAQFQASHRGLLPGAAIAYNTAVLDDDVAAGVINFEIFLMPIIK